MKVANPQGKGALPLVQSLEASRPRDIPYKSPSQVLEQYCLSALVLGANFRFKPVPLKPYYLYLTNGSWELSLISPQEWGALTQRIFVARCELRTDMTWAVDVDVVAVEHETVSDSLQQHVEAFNHNLREKGSIEAALPFYVRELPYYQRLLASGLAASLNHSIARLEGPERLRLNQLAVPV